MKNSIAIDETLSNICVLLGRVVNKIKQTSVFNSKILLRVSMIGIAVQQRKITLFIRQIQVIPVLH